MNNTIVFLNDNRLGSIYEDHEEAIASCVTSAVAKAAQVMGPSNFVAAVCSRNEYLENRLAA